MDSKWYQVLLAIITLLTATIILVTKILELVIKIEEQAKQKAHNRFKPRKHKRK